MRALAAPVLGHLDPQFIGIMDDLRARLARTMFRAPEGTLALAVSGTGTAAMEAAVANLVEPGRRVLVVVTGYFGERLVDMCTRYGGARDARGRRVGPRDRSGRRRGRALEGPRSISLPSCTRRPPLASRNPVPEVAALAHAHGALSLADAVTSLGGQEVDMAAWGIDACYSGTQKCIGAPSGLAPIAFAPSALARRVAVPQLLPRSVAARGLLGAPQVPPHDVGVAGLRARRGAGRDRGGRSRVALGAARRDPRAFAVGDGRRWASGCCRPPTSG